MMHHRFAAGVVTSALLGSPLGAWAQSPPADAPSAAVPPAPPAAAAPPAGAPSSAPLPPSAAPTPPSRGPPPYPYPYPYRYGAEPPLPSDSHWYGWQTLIVMGVSTLLSVFSPVGGGTSAWPTVPLTLIPLALGGFTLGGPVVHWANGHVAKGFISLGMNVGGVMLGGVTGALVECTSRCGGEGFGGLLGFIIGSGLGLLAANIVDVSVLSYDERPPARAASAVGWRLVSLVPTLELQKERSFVGLKGTF